MLLSSQRGDAKGIAFMMIMRTMKWTLVVLGITCWPNLINAGEKSPHNASPTEETDGPPRMETPEDTPAPPPGFTPKMPAVLSQEENSAAGEGERNKQTDPRQVTSEGETTDDVSPTGPFPDTLDDHTNTVEDTPSKDDNRAERTQTADKAPVFGKLSIETEPEGARISVSVVGTDFQEIAGESPLQLKLPTNHYRVTLEKEGYETAVAEVTVDPGRVAWLRIKLEPERSGPQKSLRLAGHLLFWPGIATSATGIILLVVDDPVKDVNTGKPGYVVAGVGVAMTVLGGIFLGLTYRDKSVYTIPPVALSPTPDMNGATLSFSKSF